MGLYYCFNLIWYNRTAMDSQYRCFKLRLDGARWVYIIAPQPVARDVMLARMQAFYGLNRVSDCIPLK